MKAVHRQRTILCDLLGSLSQEQWEAETLCDGWDAGDMVAHLLVRERQPWNSAGILVPALEKMHESAMAKKKEEGRTALTQQLRDGPPWPLARGPLGRIQVGEDYIHTEDIRRGGAATVSGEGAASLEPDDGTGDSETAGLLWEALKRFATMTLGGLKAEGVISLTDGSKTRNVAVGGRLATSTREMPPGAEVYTVTGPVGDLLLWVTGRSAANVETGGSLSLESALGRSRRV
ncbi:maleylpyruvate isomerase family mycothiol-dependent enzyme [Euzebya tangerina]|uniref:maleylpyruvate isomerase family mycothiol-dependent enzyme n=1 Tax=Euzebya tangerina TaxID=591198 RepID=UPI000E318120|nr:maleylpyruvate isomerase family mycothiol-dependent enzyme [Euzebya tangerina]